VHNCLLAYMKKIDSPTINNNVVTQMQYDSKNENSKYEQK